MSNKTKESKPEPHLKVYKDRSVLMKNSTQEVFYEGKPSQESKLRLKAIRETLDKGYLRRIIEECKQPEVDLGQVTPDHEKLIKSLVDSVSSEVGRALLGLSILQACVKCIAPEQNIRLHKAGNGEFSWIDGIPMRVLDKEYFTPILREYGLLRLNADGIMMTRSLAENYPYTLLYKAAIRGAREEWMSLVDAIEDGSVKPNAALKRMIALLHNRSEHFRKTAEDTLRMMKVVCNSRPSKDEAISFVTKFVDQSSYCARVFEIALHSLFQVLEDLNCFDGKLKPLSQMRSANKKHGNVGDIEITVGGSNLSISESWDAKYGKSYLRDELEELSEKLTDHPETKSAGFVVDRKPNLKSEIMQRLEELEQIHSVKIEIVMFDDWARKQIARTGEDESKVVKNWLMAFAECLCQLRRERAPIDEPSDMWVTELRDFAETWVKTKD